VLAAPDAIITIDARGRIVQLNPAAEEMFGYAREQALGRQVASLIIPRDSRGAHRSGLERLAAGGPPRILGRRNLMSAITADGGELPVELTVTRTQEAPPRFTAWIRDLSERTPGEVEAAHRQAWLDSAEAVAGLGSWRFSPETAELRWSDNLYRLFGLRPGEIAPATELVFSFVHPDDRDRVERYVELIATEDDPRQVEYRIVLPDLGVRHVRSTIGLIVEPGGGQRQLFGTVQDITAERRTEREIAAHIAASDALNGWESLAQTAADLLKGLAQAMEFQVGILWLPLDETLVARAVWRSASLVAPEFERAIRKLRLRSGVGLVGRAWESGEPVADSGCVSRSRYRSRELDLGAGLRGALAFPAVHRGQVLAVLGFAAQEEIDLTDGLMRSLIGIGHELGAFLVRRRGELVPPRLTPRELEVLRLAADGQSGPRIAEQLSISPNTVKTHFRNVFEKLGVSDRATAVAEVLRQGLIE
jgi:PAS domain S-box-containing protein